MRKYILLLLAACLVILGLTLSQTFHDLLPHNLSGDVHHEVHHHPHHTPDWIARSQRATSLIRDRVQAYQIDSHEESQDEHENGAGLAHDEEEDQPHLPEDEDEEPSSSSSGVKEAEEQEQDEEVESGEVAGGAAKEKKRHETKSGFRPKKSHSSGPQPVPVLEMLERAERKQEEEHAKSSSSATTPSSSTSSSSTSSSSTSSSLTSSSSTSSASASSSSSRTSSLPSTSQQERKEDHASASSGGSSSKGCVKNSECGRHGGCRRGRCVCSVFYTGSHCETPIDLPLSMLRHPFANFTAKFEGSMLLNQRKLKTQNKITVHLPGKEHEPDKGWRVLAEGKELDQMMRLIPEEDPLTSNFFETCAIVGSSGIVLNYEDGKAIDQHDMVFRFNSAPTKGFEKYVGSKTTHRITNTQNWGFKESDEENLMIHFRAKSSVKGLFWNGNQKKPWKLFAFDPDLVEYIAFKLDFMATSGLYGILIAMHRCARVDLYGFQVSTEHGTLYHYYDVCDVPANLDRDSSEYLAVKALAEAGLVHFAEPCIIECHNSKDECLRCKTSTGFKEVALPSDKKCDPNRVSRGHQEVPWRRERRSHRGGK